jgi:hypothetical protein
VIVEFYKVKTVHLNIKCQLIPLSQRNKSNSALCILFKLSLRVFLFEYFQLVWWGFVSRLNVLHIITTVRRTQTTTQILFIIEFVVWFPHAVDNFFSLFYDAFSATRLYSIDDGVTSE